MLLQVWPPVLLFVSCVPCLCVRVNFRPALQAIIRGFLERMRAARDWWAKRSRTITVGLEVLESDPAEDFEPRQAASKTVTVRSNDLVEVRSPPAAPSDSPACNLTRAPPRAGADLEGVGGDARARRHTGGVLCPLLHPRPAAARAPDVGEVHASGTAQADQARVRAQLGHRRAPASGGLSHRGHRARRLSWDENGVGNDVRLTMFWHWGWY
jgi:hypothetical protein